MKILKRVDRRREERSEEGRRGEGRRGEERGGEERRGVERRGKERSGEEYLKLLRSRNKNDKSLPPYAFRRRLLEGMVKDSVRKTTAKMYAPFEVKR